MRSGAGAGGSGVVMVAKGVGEQQAKGHKEEEEKAWRCGDNFSWPRASPGAGESQQDT